jgi:hypothetical protein
MLYCFPNLLHLPEHFKEKKLKQVSNEAAIYFGNLNFFSKILDEEMGWELPLF